MALNIAGLYSQWKNNQKSLADKKGSLEKNEQGLDQVTNNLTNAEKEYLAWQSKAQDLEAESISLNKLKEELSVYEDSEKIKLELNVFENKQAELTRQKEELEQLKQDLAKRNNS